MKKIAAIIVFVLATTLGLAIYVKNHVEHPLNTSAEPINQFRATYSKLHFKPDIDKASDDQCLACHQEILDDRTRTTTPAGLNAANTLAWYQKLSTYTGEQETFHRRHLVTPMAKDLMKLSCTTCHQGHDPRDEAPGTSASGPTQDTRDFTLRKQVNVETTCLKCHGKMSFELMGLPAPWPDSREMFGKSCLTCHSAIRTNRHQVSYLNAEAIEQQGQQNDEVCFGCHGGRAWYRISYPYPRHPWEGMPTDTPDWAKQRPTESESRFLKPVAKTTGK